MKCFHARKLKMICFCFLQQRLNYKKTIFNFRFFILIPCNNNKKFSVKSF